MARIAKSRRFAVSVCQAWGHKLHQVLVEHKVPIDHGYINESSTMYTAFIVTNKFKTSDAVQDFVWEHLASSIWCNVQEDWI